MNPYQLLDQIRAEHPEPVAVCHARILEVCEEMTGTRPSWIVDPRYDDHGRLIGSPPPGAAPVPAWNPAPAVKRPKAKPAPPVAAEARLSDLRPRARQRLGELMAARQRIDAQVQALLRGAVAA